MQKFGKAQPVTRREDVRFLTGAGSYTSDTVPADALVAVFVRSQVAHGRIISVDADDARAMPGVAAILTAEDALADGVDLAIPFVPTTNHDGSAPAQPQRPFLAQDRVRFVGEPIAVVVAETTAQALDASEAVMVEIEDLPAKLDVTPGGETLHDAARDNVAYDFGLGDEDATAAALAEAAHLVRVTVPDNRILSVPLETRACLADWDGVRLHMTFGGQGVWNLKRDLAKLFHLDKGAVHVTIPDVGGGFGTKTMAYPEYFATALASKRLGRPVAWVSERGEGMLTDNAGRDLVSEVTLGFDAAHRITAYKVETLGNLGAYCSGFAQLIQSRLFSRVLTGPYDIRPAWLRSRGIFTNTTQVDAFRGAGRPEAIFVLERAMDRAARQMGLDPWELRRINFIPEGVFPYDTVAGETYDVGAFARVLDRAEAVSDRAGFEARRADSTKRGRLRGMGLAYYIESILGQPSEAATVEFTEDGGVRLYVGTQSNGQGHETVFAQFLSDQTGIPAEAIEIVQGDSDRIAHGGGTGGSRSATTQNTATLSVATDAVAALAAFLEEQTDSEVTFDEDRFRIHGSNETPTVLDVVARAREAGRDDLTRFTGEETLPGRSFPNGAHVVEVEVDPETGQVTVERYNAVDDFGNLLNPLLAEGQVHGGVAHGLGQVLMERVGYDADGQILTASLMDYAVPRASDMPFVGFHSHPVPSTANPLGIKGCGEAGTVGALGAIVNAVEDALQAVGVDEVTVPLTPLRVWQAMETAAEARDAAE